MPPATDVTREQVLRLRHHRHGLGRADGTGAALLDLGVQDSGGPAAARWALSIRGVDANDDALLYAWTLRGAPHAYRRTDAAAVAAATAPLDEADAAKRIFDAAKPLREAGIPVPDALRTVSDHLRDIVRQPTSKGDASAALSARLPPPYLRWCRSCDATHIYEQPFRLAALAAGLELVPDTSPPVLARIDGWAGPADVVPDRLDVVRGVLRLLGPSTPQLVAGYIDGPVRTVKAHWPADAVEVRVDGDRRWVPSDDLPLLRDPPTADGWRLLGAFDPWLQTRDRDLLVADAGRRKDVWRVLGRPGAVLAGHEIVGTWRPRSSGDDLRLYVDLWDGGAPPGPLGDEAERLAAHRGQRFAGWGGD